MNGDNQAVGNQIERYVAGVPYLYKRNIPFPSAYLLSGTLPRNQRRPRALSDKQKGDMRTVTLKDAKKIIARQRLFDLGVRCSAEIKEAHPTPLTAIAVS